MPNLAVEIFGDVRFNAIFFIFGIFAVGAAFAAGLITSLMPYVEGGPVAGASAEYALLTALAAALAGTGFAALGFGAFVFCQNYEPIKPEAHLVAFASIPYGVFLISSYFARIRAGGANDYFTYAVSRTAEGTASFYVWIPESYATLGPFLVVGAVASVVVFWGLAQFMSNMKIVKEVGTWTIRLTKAVGMLSLAGGLLMFLGWSSLTTDNPGTEWFGVPFILYYTGYLTLAFAVPALGTVVAWRIGAIFWDAAKTVRYLSDFSKRTSAVAAQERARAAADGRPWWEKLAEEGDEKR